MNSVNTRTAYAVLREQMYILKAVPIAALPRVARGFARTFNLPPKVMLKVMRRYVRLYR